MSIDDAPTTEIPALDDSTPTVNDEGDMLYEAWGLIANASVANWDDLHSDWTRAAIRWRDRWHAYLNDADSPPIPEYTRADYDAVPVNNLTEDQLLLRDAANLANATGKPVSVYVDRGPMRGHITIRVGIDAPDIE